MKRAFSPLMVLIWIVSAGCSSPTAPSQISVSASPTRLPVGQTTTVSASEGHGLSYVWSASCAGSWSQPSSPSAHFTSSALPAGSCDNCTLTVTVYDVRGKQTTSGVALCVTPAEPPFIVSASRSSDTAAPLQQLTFGVVAHDPAGSALSFSWAASLGTLGGATPGDSSS